MTVFGPYIAAVFARGLAPAADVMLDDALSRRGLAVTSPLAYAARAKELPYWLEFGFEFEDFEFSEAERAVFARAPRPPRERVDLARFVHAEPPAVGR